MKQGRSLPALAEEITRQMNTKEDFIAKSNVLRLTSQGQSDIIFPGAPARYIVSDHAHSQIATHLGIPAPYYKRMRADYPGLLDTNVNTLFGSAPEAERRMLRTMDGNARAFLSDRYRRLDNYDLLEAILPTLMETPGLEFASADVTDTKLYLKVRHTGLERAVKVGDPVQIGLVISNSEVGNGSLSILPFTTRLICTNGMTHQEFGTRRAHIGRAQGDGEDAFRFYTDETLEADDKAFWLKARDTVKATLSENVLERVVEQMRDAAGIKIEADPVQAVERLAKQKGLNQSEQSGVLKSLIEGRDLSLWGLANAVTSVAGEAEDYDRASELETLGGSLLSMGRSQIRELALAA